LTVSDLVKNHLTRLLRPTHKGVDLVKDQWNQILTDFARSEIDININRLLHHSWLSRKPYITEKKLFKEIKRTVNKATAKTFLDTLRADSELYRQIVDPNSHKWTKQERRIADSLRAMNIFRVVQPVPMLLALLREYHADTLTLKQAKAMLQKMEDFHVQFTAVTAQRTGGGTALMYASSARQLLEAANKNEKSQILTEFTKKLRERIPSEEEFTAGFVDICFTDQNTRLRQLVRYLLRRLDRHIRTGPEPNYEMFTIEHLGPQNPKTKADHPSKSVGQVGNLLFSSEDVNGKLKNADPLQKLLQFKNVGHPLDDELLKATEWTEEAIANRTNFLAHLFYTEILSV